MTKIENPPKNKWTKKQKTAIVDHKECSWFNVKMSTKNHDDKCNNNEHFHLTPTAKYLHTHTHSHGIHN